MTRWFDDCHLRRVPADCTRGCYSGLSGHAHVRDHLTFSIGSHLPPSYTAHRFAAIATFDVHGACRYAAPDLTVTAPVPLTLNDRSPAVVSPVHSRRA